MKGVKHLLCAIIALTVSVVAVSAQATGQAGTENTDSQKKSEKTVEESYLQESIETMVIKEEAQAESRDMKLVSLQYIGDAIQGGRANEQIEQTLEFLAQEGVQRVTKESNRVTNNFWDVRAKSCEYLGAIGTEPAKNALLRVVYTDPEPMVLVEAVKSLGKIGKNDGDEVSQAISAVLRRFDILHPDNSFALEALNAIDLIAQKNNGIKDPSAVQAILRIAEGQYIRPVQNRAKELLSKLRTYQ
jgi:hypothetical protein